MVGEAPSTRMSKTKKSSVSKGGGEKDANSTRTKTRRSEKKDATDVKSVMTDKGGTTPNGGGNTKREKGEVYTNEAKAAMRTFSHLIVQNGLHALRTQYVDVKAFVPADPSKTHFDANPTKCRYKDVPCWDRTRIVLTWPPGVQGDFIHANRISHELLESQQFICCQGPLDATVPDFWRCVWQENVKQIIMLCRCQELGKDKCAQYWPAKVGDSLTFHGLQIKCKKVDSSDKSFVHTKLALTFDGKTRTVDHRQWTSWPDKSVPKTPMAPFRLLQYTRKNPKSPTIIHCSAGVGRTGTLVAVELVYKSLVAGKVPDVAALVKDIRSQRSTAVQTEDQYLYVHYAVLQLLHVKSIVPSHFVKHFVKEYENYLKLLNDNGGKNLPMQATSLPNPCATCTKIAAHLNDPAKDKDQGAGNSPPSEKQQGSKRDVASKTERKAVGEQNTDRKANLVKMLKDKKKKEELNEHQGKKDGSGQGKPEMEKKDHDKPSEQITTSPPPTTTTYTFLSEFKTMDPTSVQPPPGQTGQTYEASNEDFKAATQPAQPPPPPVPTSSVPEEQHGAPQQQQHNFPQSQLSPAVPPGGNPKEEALPAKSPVNKYQYKPAATYTIQQAGDEKAIVYHRNSAQPYVKAFAAPPGQVQPQILVNMNSPAPNQGQGQGQAPPQNAPPPTSHQPGVPFMTNPSNGNTNQ